jgi:hypothetical protein
MGIAIFAFHNLVQTKSHVGKIKTEAEEVIKKNLDWNRNKLLMIHYPE